MKQKKLTDKQKINKLEKKLEFVYAVNQQQANLIEKLEKNINHLTYEICKLININNLLKERDIFYNGDF